MKKMKKVVSALAIAFLAFSFAACGDSDDDSGSSSGAQSGSQGGTASAGSTVSTGNTYTKSVRINLSENPLKTDFVAKIAVGDNVAEYFALSTIAESSDRAVSAATASANDGLTDFKAIVTAISATRLDVQISAKTKSENCTVLITENIPAEYTEKGVAIVQVVDTVIVGTVTKTDDTSSISLSNPTADEVKNLVLKVSGKSGSAVSTYFVFDENGTTATRKYVYTSGGTAYSCGDTEFTYDAEACTLTSSESSDDPLHLVKSADSYYLYELEKLRCTSGSGLYATFGFSDSSSDSDTEKLVSVTYDEAGNRTEIETDVIITKHTEEESSMSITVGKDGSFVGSQLYSLKETHTYSDDSPAYSSTTTASSVINGIYTNKGGILTLGGKLVTTTTETTNGNYYSYSDETDISTEINDIDGDIVLYDGTNLIFTEYALAKTDDPQAESVEAWFAAYGNDEEWIDFTNPTETVMLYNKATQRYEIVITIGNTDVKIELTKGAGYAFELFYDSADEETKKTFQYADNGFGRNQLLLPANGSYRVSLDSEQETYSVEKI